MTPETFDYIIIGAGAAGLHLAMAMSDDLFFEGKKILIIDKDQKQQNDRTWCYWETGTGKWDTIAHRIWDYGRFTTGTESKQLILAPYKYKMVRGIDFYDYARRKLSNVTNVTWKQDEVVTLNLAGKPEVIGKDHRYYASHIFDSRIDPAFFNSNHKSVKVLQHFKGWVIETESDVFNSKEFVMMDFRIKWKNETGFIYILPSSERKALVEFTMFTPDLIEDKDYDSVLKKYIHEILKTDQYTISETEYGVIPMTNFAFHKQNDMKLTKIGTAGSWVKPSSGYSFKNAERNSQKVIRNIKNGEMPSKGIGMGRFRKYDTLFLDILQHHNELGEEIFTSMYTKNKTASIFKFLDEETSIAEDIRIISSFRPAPFQRALRKHWREWV